MKGENELHLNAATVIEALQEYFDKRFVQPFGKITAFTAIDTGYTETYKLTIRENIDDNG